MKENRIYLIHIRDCLQRYKTAWSECSILTYDRFDSVNRVNSYSRDK